MAGATTRCVLFAAPLGPAPRSSMHSQAPSGPEQAGRVGCGPREAKPPAGPTSRLCGNAPRRWMEWPRFFNSLLIGGDADAPGARPAQSDAHALGPRRGPPLLTRPARMDAKKSLRGTVTHLRPPRGLKGAMSERTIL
jgi:hypothetical protein